MDSFKRNEKLEEKISRKRVSGYREHFEKLGRSNDLKAAMRDQERLAAKQKIKIKYDEPILERSKMDYLQGLKSGGGGKRLSDSYLNHRAHGRGVVQVGGVNDYQKAMKRRNPDSDIHVRSPEYRRVFNLPQNPKILAHSRTNSERRQRLFG